MELGASTMNGLVWVGIFLCLSQSAMFSGLNLALLGISRLRLEVEASGGNEAAIRILALRQDSNFLLSTILWGNVAINVLLTLLSDSVMTGVTAFFFSTMLITFFGEITPQAYFSRNAMRMGSLLAPVLRAYQILLYPVARPSALVLDAWLGKENVSYFNERDLRKVIGRHIEADETDLDRLEGIGAMNFMALDDLLVTQEGELLDPASIIALPLQDGRPVFPDFRAEVGDSFLQAVNASTRKWVVLTGPDGTPQWVMNANAFLRAALFSETEVRPEAYCHRPIIVSSPDTLLGKVLTRLRVYPEHVADDVIDDDMVLVWAEQKRIITGADILGRLLHGIVERGERPWPVT